MMQLFKNRRNSAPGSPGAVEMGFMAEEIDVESGMMAQEVAAAGSGGKAETPQGAEGPDKPASPKRPDSPKGAKGKPKSPRGKSPGGAKKKSKESDNNEANMASDTENEKKNEENNKNENDENKVVDDADAKKKRRSEKKSKKRKEKANMAESEGDVVKEEDLMPAEAGSTLPPVDTDEEEAERAGAAGGASTDEDIGDGDGADKKKKKEPKKGGKGKKGKKAGDKKKGPEVSAKDKTAIVNGQQITLGNDWEAMRAQWTLEDMEMGEMKMNEQKILLLKVLSRSKWGKWFKNLEINDDPIRRWTHPIVRVTMNLRVEQLEKALFKMEHYVVRCMTLDPPNEGKIRELRLQLEDLHFKFRKTCELEHDYDPLYETAMTGLRKTQERLDSLSAGMGFEASEASASSQCQEGAMERLKDTRKQMQYTVAQLNG